MTFFLQEETSAGIQLLLLSLLWVVYRMKPFLLREKRSLLFSNLLLSYDQKPVFSFPFFVCFPTPMRFIAIISTLMNATDQCLAQGYVDQAFQLVDDFALPPVYDCISMVH